MPLKKTILFPASVISLVPILTPKSLGKKIILIFQMLLVFILSNLIDNCYAYSDNIKNISYDNIFKAIRN